MWKQNYAESYNASLFGHQKKGHWNDYMEFKILYILSHCERACPICFETWQEYAWFVNVCKAKHLLECAVILLIISFCENLMILLYASLQKKTKCHDKNCNVKIENFEVLNKTEWIAMGILLEF